MIDIARLSAEPMQANAYLARRVGSAEGFLVDPGDGYLDLRRAIDERALRVTDILLTHGHFDHMLAAARLAREENARVWIRAADAPMLTAPSAALYQRSYATTAFEPVEGAAVLDAGKATFAGIEVEVLPCPGHTPGGAAFYLPEAGAVFTGDTLFVGGVGRTDFPGGDEAALRRSIQSLLALPGETVAHPGHGRSATIAAIGGDFR
ncbi:MAG: MBL fold metallo-hydrolase [Clostridiales bacterium]|nr:MBL fold metallo-hydrolase [Clostridiales bacterium]